MLDVKQIRCAQDDHVCLFFSQTTGVPGRPLYSRSDILATDECSRAAHISRVVQTSKQAARAAGGGETQSCIPCELVFYTLLFSYQACLVLCPVAEEFDPEENLHSAEDQSHM